MFDFLSISSLFFFFLFSLSLVIRSYFSASPSSFSFCVAAPYEDSNRADDEYARMLAALSVGAEGSFSLKVGELVLV